MEKMTRKSRPSDRTDICENPREGVFGSERYKPSSVPWTSRSSGDSHLSGMYVTVHLERTNFSKSLNDNAVLALG